MKRSLPIAVVCLVTLSVAQTTTSLQADDPTGTPLLQVWGLAFSPQGDLLAVAAGNRDENGGRVLVFDTESWDVVFAYDHSVSVNCVAFSPGGDQLAAGTQTGDVLLIDPATGEPIRHWPTAQQCLNSVCWTPDLKIMTAGNDGRVNQWNASSGELERSFDTREADGMPETIDLPQDAPAEPRQIWDVAVSGNGRWLAAGVSSESMQLWDLQSGEWLFKFDARYSPITGVAFTPDDGHCVSISFQAVMIRETETGLDRAALRMGGRDVSMHRDGRLMAIASFDAIQVYEINLTHPDDESFRNYEELIARLEDDDIAVRDAASEQIIKIGLPIEPLLLEAIYSPFAETRMRSRGLWNKVRSPEPLATLEGHTVEPTRAVFSPNGAILASSSRSGEVLIWSVPDFELRERINVNAVD